MDIGISENLSISYSTETPSAKKAVRENTDSSAVNGAEDKKANTVAATYQKSDEKDSNSSKQIYKPDMETIQKLKDDVEARSSQLRTLIEKMLTKQGQAFNRNTDIFQLLRTGEISVDPETAAQAKEEISEDGYWGINQTSDRLVSFAKAISGGDPSKADDMIEAFKKGYSQATKSWGSNLPDICKETYDLTIQKLTDWKNSADTTGNTTEA